MNRYTKTMHGMEWSVKADGPPTDAQWQRMYDNWAMKNKTVGGVHKLLAKGEAPPSIEAPVATEDLPVDSKPSPAKLTGLLPPVAPSGQQVMDIQDPETGLFPAPGQVDVLSVDQQVAAGLISFEDDEKVGEFEKAAQAAIQATEKQSLTFEERRKARAAGSAKRMQNLAEDANAPEVLAEELLLQQEAENRNPVMDAIIDTASDAAVETAKWVGRITTRLPTMAAGALADPIEDMYNTLDTYFASAKIDTTTVALQNVRELRSDPNIDPEDARRLDWHIATMLDRRRELRDDIGNNTLRLIGHIDNMEKDLQDRATGSGFWGSVASTGWNLMTDARDTALGVGYLLFGDIMGFDETPYEEASTDFYDWIQRTLETGYAKGGDLTTGAAGAAFALAGSLPRAFIEEGEHDIYGTNITLRGTPGVLPQAIESRPLTTILYFVAPLRSARDRYVAAGKAVPKPLELAVQASDRSATIIKDTLLKTADAAGVDAAGRARVAGLVAGVQRATGDSLADVEINTASQALNNSIVRGRREVEAAVLDVGQTVANAKKNNALLQVLGSMDEAALVDEYRRLMDQDSLRQLPFDENKDARWRAEQYENSMLELTTRTDMYWRDQDRHPGKRLVAPAWDIDQVPQYYFFRHDPATAVSREVLLDMVRGYLQHLRRREAEMALDKPVAPLPPPVGQPETPPPSPRVQTQLELDRGPAAPLSTRADDGTAVWNGAFEFPESTDFGRPLPGKRNRWGIYSHEWDSFVDFALKNEPELNATGITASAPDHLISRAAVKFYRRIHPAQSAPMNAVIGGLHRFTPVEIADWGRFVIGYLQMGKSMNKAEFMAYRDILRGRGMDVTSDYRSLGLKIPGDDKAPPGGLADEAVGEAGSGVLVSDGYGTVNNNQNVAPPRPTDRTAAEARAQFEKQLNDAYPEIDSRNRYGSYSPDADHLRKIVQTVRTMTGEEGAPIMPPTPTERAVSAQPLPPEVVGLAQAPQGTRWYVPEGRTEWTTAGAQPTLGLEPAVLLPAEVVGRINRLAEDLNMPAEPIAAFFAELLDWNSGKAFASEGLRREMVSRLKKEIKNSRVLSQYPKGERGRQLRIRVDRLEAIMNSYRKGLPVESPVVRNTYLDGSGFNVKQELHKLVMEKPKLTDQFMRDAVLNAAAALSDEAGAAHVKNAFRRGLADSPSNIINTAIGIERALQDKRSPLPAVLRVPPSAVENTMYRRRADARPTLQGGQRMGETLTQNDILAARQGLAEYTKLGDEQREWLGLTPEDGDVWVSQSMKDNIAIEILQQEAIRRATWIDRISRTTKRGLVALSAATIGGNFQSDLVLAMMQQGSVNVVAEVIKSALAHSKWRHGRTRRKDDRDTYDMQEKFVDVGLLEATVLEPEGIGMQNHKGALVLVENASARVGGRPARDAIRRSGEFVEKWWNRPTLRAFRAGTNAFKVWRAEKAFKQMRDWAENSEPNGAIFEMEVFPNVWRKYQKSVGKNGEPVILYKGKPMTRSDWFKDLARASKVTSDWLFFDYNDASLTAKGLRALPGLRATAGSLFYMWWYKSIYLPGVKRGLIKDAFNPNPAYRSNSPQIRAEMADRASQANRMTAAMATGARAAGVQQSDEILEKMGWTRREVGNAWLQYTGRPDHVMAYNASNMNVFTGQDLITRMLTSAGVDFAEAVGVFDGDDGELSKLYPRDGKGRVTAGLDKIQNKDERRWMKQMRELVIRNSTAGIVTGKDHLEAIGLAGGPLLEALVSISNDDAQQQATNMPRLWRKLGYGMMGANAGRLIDVSIAAVNPSSEMTSFTYTIRDPQGFLSQDPGERHRQTIRWAMRTLMTRTWSQVNLRKQGVNKYMEGWDKGFKRTILSPFDRAIKDAGALGDEDRVKELAARKALYSQMWGEFKAELTNGWNTTLKLYNIANKKAATDPPSQRRPRGDVYGRKFVPPPVDVDPLFEPTSFNEADKPPEKKSENATQAQ